MKNSAPKLIFKQQTQKYNERYIHFDFDKLPKMLGSHLLAGPLELVDLGSGDGPWFNALIKKGYLSPNRHVYAVDLDDKRLERIVERFPWITTVLRSAESVPEIKDQSIDFVISTMVMEHVLDEVKYLKEIHRLLKPSGKAYITTVYKRKWAWFYRKRGGESVLDTSHVREYTDLDSFRKIFTDCDLEIMDLNLSIIKISVMKPIFRIWKRRERSLNLALKLLLWPKFPVPGYYELEVVVQPMTQKRHFNKAIP